MTLLTAMAASMLISALAASAHAPDSPTVVHVGVTTEINVDFELSGKDAVGFVHRQRTAKEEAAVDRALEALRSPNEWMRFNPEAQCRQSAISIGGNIYRSIDPDAPPASPPIIKPAFDVHFTYACDAMAKLRTMDLMLISRFPHVREVIVDVRTAKSHHAEIVTTATGSITLSPD